jgi:hypothetical protein
MVTISFQSTTGQLQTAVCRSNTVDGNYYFRATTQITGLVEKQQLRRIQV